MYARIAIAVPTYLYVHENFDRSAPLFNACGHGGVVKEQRRRRDPIFFANGPRWIGLLAGLNHHKAGAKAKLCANPLGQKMKLWGESLAAVALCLAISTPALAEPS
ncbi:MAG TPA: hypothetical protein VFQ52_04850, partial [Rhizomicrobium sp.]|nr:hypothetical protein [Rhizomicrobium sp.]